jgi:hypothetical protein
MKAQGPPYLAAIWFVVIAGSIGVTIHLVLLLRPFLAPSPNPSVPKRNFSSPVLALSAIGHQCSNTLRYANRQLSACG